MTFLQNKQKTCSQKKTSLCRNENAATQLQKGKGRSYQWNFKTRIYNWINYCKKSAMGRERSIPHKTVLLKQWAECGQIILSHRPG